jgi:signal transduction histidine kinase
MFALREHGDGPDLNAVAHDLNNLLTAISGYAGLIESSRESTPTVQRDAAEIGDAAAQAVQLVRQLQKR